MKAKTREVVATCPRRCCLLACTLFAGLRFSASQLFFASALSSSSSSSSSSIRALKQQRPIKVAIIGGGIAGLSCAQHLTQQDNNVFDVTVFDTGRLRPGGRCSSRMPGDLPKEEDDDGIHMDNDSENRKPPVRQYPLLSHFLYDHAAQILTVPSTKSNLNEHGTSKTNKNDNHVSFEAFQNQVNEWESKGVIQRFAPESVYSINSSNGIISTLDGTEQFYFGTNGMGSIPQSMVTNNNDSFELKQDVWVSPSNGARWMSKTQQWKLQAKGQVLGYYDRLVIAHNGKCADRLLSKTPAKAVHSLLRVNFADRVAAATGGKRMTLNSIYSLTVVCRKDNSILSQVLPESFVCGFVQNHPNIKFLSCQTRKYKQQQQQQQYDNDMEDYEVWTILSSARFAKQYKAPQEFLSDETINTVSSLLLKSVEEAVGIRQQQQSTATTAAATTTSITNSRDDKRLEDTILECRLQLWGAALPLNVWQGKPERGFIYDANYGVGVCGDWLVDPSIAGAWTSGKLLADYMMSQQEPNHPPSIGLEGSFRRSESANQAGIGALIALAKAKQATVR